MVGDGTMVVVLEVFLQGHGVVRDVHHRAQVVGEHLRRHRQYAGLRRHLMGLCFPNPPRSRLFD